MITDFSKYFNGFKRVEDESSFPMPSQLIPKEIERWELYQKLVAHRTNKYLIADKDQFIKYLNGDTLPLARVFEASQTRPKELNPMYDKINKIFPLWDAISRLVHLIGEDYKSYTVKAGLISALKDYINFLKSLNLKELDDKVRKYDGQLHKKRKAIISAHIASKTKLKNYPHYLFSTLPALPNR